ncbi:MAG: hypothetical protein Q7N50_11605 [Armatimonadota bacterium]|nr:hypothetical protein [Armatimonadota bacterium]
MVRNFIDQWNQRIRRNPVQLLASRLIADEIRDARKTSISEDERLLQVETYLDSRISEIVYLALDISISTQAEGLRKAVANAPYEESLDMLTVEASPGSPAAL